MPTPWIKDNNYVRVLMGVDSTDPTKMLPLKIDSATGGLMVE